MSEIIDAGIYETLHHLYEPYLLNGLNQYPALHIKMTHILFGIARNAIKASALQCARRILLWMEPIDTYSGSYSLWPVVTDTVVLSLPRMMGTSIALCIVGSWEILSCS